MKQLISYYYIFLILLLGSYELHSQRKFKRFNYIDGWSVTPSVSLGSINGELGNIFDFNILYGINIEKGLSERVNLKLELVGGIMDGFDDEKYHSSFKNNFFQVAIIPSLNLSRIHSERRKKLEFLPYLGLGLVWFNTNVFDLKSGKFLRATADGTTKHTSLFQQAGIGVGDAGIYYTRELVVPIGVDINYYLSERFMFNANLGYNYIYNDKFDGTTPYNLTNPFIVGGVNSYSETANDAWIRLSIGLKFRLSSFITENPRGV